MDSTLPDIQTADLALGKTIFRRCSPRKLNCAKVSSLQPDCLEINTICCFLSLFQGHEFPSESRLSVISGNLTGKPGYTNFWGDAEHRECPLYDSGDLRILLTIATKSEKLYGLLNTARAPASFARW